MLRNILEHSLNNPEMTRKCKSHWLIWTDHCWKGLSPGVMSLLGLEEDQARLEAVCDPVIEVPDVWGLRKMPSLPNFEQAVLEWCAGPNIRQPIGGRVRVDLWARGVQDLSIDPDWQTGLNTIPVYLINRGTLTRQEWFHRDRWDVQWSRWQQWCCGVDVEYF